MYLTAQLPSTKYRQNLSKTFWATSVAVDSVLKLFKDLWGWEMSIGLTVTCFDSTDEDPEKWHLIPLKHKAIANHVPISLPTNHPPYQSSCSKGTNWLSKLKCRIPRYILCFRQVPDILVQGHLLFICHWLGGVCVCVHTASICMHVFSVSFPLEALPSVSLTL